MRHVLLFFVFSIALTSSSRATAANAVVNPDFDVDASNWFESNAQIHVGWDATRNKVGVAGSGAGFVSNTHSIAGATFSIDQCVLFSGVAPGTTYDFGAWVFTPSGQGTSGNAKVEIVYWDADNCVGQKVATLATATSVGFDSWSLQTSSSLAPAGSKSVQIRLALQKNEAASVYSVAFDGVRFGPAPTTPVTLQEFSVK
jgi:hypothetical protein